MQIQSFVRNEIGVRRILRYHGLGDNECPLKSSHTLTIVSHDLAICHDCGLEWDVIDFHQVLANTTYKTAMDELLSMVTRYPAEPPSVSYGDAGPELSTHDISFIEWLQVNRTRILGLEEYDGHPLTAIGFLTTKRNLVLLPQGLEQLPFRLVQQWVNQWEDHGLLRTQREARGIKRTQRVPLELRKAQDLSETMRLYTFHRWETNELIGPLRPFGKVA